MGELYSDLKLADGENVFPVVRFLDDLLEEVELLGGFETKTN